MKTIKEIAKEYINDEWLEIIQNSLPNIELIDDGIIPMKPDIFNAFKYVDIKELKVIIVGQDPYHTIKNGQIVADGLAFSVNKELINYCPPSLRNIKKELYFEYNRDFEGNSLVSWAKQGVLLLNRSLTTKIGNPNYFQKQWIDFLPTLIKEITLKYDNLVFILWGNDAKSLAQYIQNPNKHLILSHSHPSPLSRNKFVGNLHFKKCNEYLLINAKKPIDWFLSNI